MSDPVAGFYDGLAERYQLLFDDWWAAADWQGGVLGSLLASEGINVGASVLDCTCGIGTQALPLASRGYVVSASDISTAEVDRARVEAARRGLPVDCFVADVRDLADSCAGRFDAVISCDNALTHLLTERDLASALASIRSRLKDDGVLLATIRDYDDLSIERPAGIPPTVSGAPGSRRAVAQSWRWSPDGSMVDIVLFVLDEREDAWHVTVHEVTYRAWTRSQFTDLLLGNGFDDVRWLPPADSGYYQPVVIGRASA